MKMLEIVGNNDKQRLALLLLSRMSENIKTNNP